MVLLQNFQGGHNPTQPSVI